MAENRTIMKFSNANASGRPDCLPRWTLVAPNDHRPGSGRNSRPHHVSHDTSRHNVLESVYVRGRAGKLKTKESFADKKGENE